MLLKTFLEQKLKETSILFESTAEKEKRDALQEEAYWLGQALENENPQDVLTRAFSFWEKSNGKTGLKPFELPQEIPLPLLFPPKTDPSSGGEKGENTPPATLTMWGIIDRAFQSGEHLDDRHVSEIFNHLPHGAQTHFIDT